MTDFKVSKATLVPDKNQVVLHGSFANGSVKAGMKVKVSGLALEISGVSMNFTPEGFQVGVILQCASEADLAAWKGLNVGPGQLLTLAEPTSS
jgi:hypothetical protein